jgi:hypothetical protein
MEKFLPAKKLLLLLFYLNLVGCKGCKDSLQPDINQLPPITQDGANTFGAIVNGKVWVPAGYINGSFNMMVSYYPGSYQGTLDVACYRQTDTISSDNTHLGFYLDSLENYKMPHTFILRPFGNVGFEYIQYCLYDSSDSTTQSSGSVTVSKLDTVAGIISGIFSVVLIRAGCDTINITDGRFDLKL